MTDQAGIMMAQGGSITSKRIQGVNGNMSKSHYHDYFELCYLEEGERYHIIQDRLYCIRPGKPLIFSSYMMHHPYGQEDMLFKRLLMYFSRKEVDSRQLLKALEQEAGVYKPDRREKQVVHRMLDDLPKEQEDPQACHKGYIHTLLNMALLTIAGKIQAPAKPEQRNRIIDVISCIYQNYQEDISIDQLAQMPYVNPYHLCREFKRYTNSTIIQYVNIARVMNAQRMSMETDKNVTEINRGTGLSDIAHFNRVFKSVMGMAPSNLRKMCKTEARHCRRTFWYGPGWRGSKHGSAKGTTPSGIQYAILLPAGPVSGGNG